MWIPKSAAEIEQAVSAGSLTETAIFDAKRELPTSAKNVEIAKDVAAMATDGGVIIYGIGEDENRRLTILNPFPLAGADERIINIVQTLVAEPPYINPIPLRMKDDEDIGFLVVVVPQSERAPHMVLGGREHRYYGRTEKGNKLLTEGEVARLYQRRQQWDVDLSAVLDDAISNAPCTPIGRRPILHMIAGPIAWSGNVWQNPTGLEGGFDAALESALRTVQKVKPRPQWTHGGFDGLGNYRRLADGVQLETTVSDGLRRNDLCEHTTRLFIGDNGVCRLFTGTVGGRFNDGQSTIKLLHLANISTQFLTFVSIVNQYTQYQGRLFICTALTGIRGAMFQQTQKDPNEDLLPITREEYRQTKSVPFSELYNDPNGIAKDLFVPILREGMSLPIDPWRS